MCSSCSETSSLPVFPLSQDKICVFDLLIAIITRSHYEILSYKQTRLSLSLSLSYVFGASILSCVYLECFNKVCYWVQKRHLVIQNHDKMLVSAVTANKKIKFRSNTTYTNIKQFISSSFHLKSTKTFTLYSFYRHCLSLGLKKFLTTDNIIALTLPV